MKLCILLCIIVNLYSFSITLKPGWNLLQLPEDLENEKVNGKNIGAQIEFDLTPMNKLQVCCIYGQRNFGINNVNEVSELYGNFAYKFNITQSFIVPYFAIGGGLKLGLYDYTANDDITLNLIGSHGYTFNLSTHFYIEPEILAYYRILSNSHFYGIMVNLGVGYEF